MIKTEKYQSAAGEISLLTLVNASGASVTLSTLGAGVVSVCVPDAEGRMADVILGYEDPADYLGDGPCAGKCPGRYANRIARGHLEIDGHTYSLPINNGPNHLHGGPEGFQNKIWRLVKAEGNEVVMEYVSPDGEMGYPGTLTARATYRWTDRNELQLTLEAETDAPTVVNLTNHSYWNLRGHDSGSALDHTLWLNASRWLPTDSTLVPTGEFAPVAGTPMDFTTAKTLGRDIKADFPALRYGKGYDNCFVIDGYEPGVLQEAAVLADSVSGRQLTIYTDQPAAQVYTGNWLTGSPLGKSGKVYEDYDAVAIECQDMPDAPNQPAFPSTRLNPGDHYERHIIYAFATL